MEKITQYKIISGNDVREIEKQVNAELKNDWQPLGGLTSLLVAGKPVFIQAIIK